MKKIVCLIVIFLSLKSVAQTYPYVIPNQDFAVTVLNNSGLDATGVASAVDYLSGAVYTCGYINTTSTGKDLALVKFDSTGAQQWIVTYDYNSLDDKANALYVDGSGNVYVTGLSEAASGNADIITLMYNSSGTQQWASRYNGTNNTNDAGNSILVDGSGNVWVCGYATTASKGKDYQMLKYNSSGTLLSAPKRNGTANGDDIAQKMAISGTNLFITGTVKGSSTNGDIYTMCLNTVSVSVTWSTAVNGTASGDDTGLDIKLDNGEVFICGKINNTTTGDDYYFARLNQSTGAILYSDTYDGGYNGTDFATALVPDALGNYGVTGIADNGSTTEYHTRLYDTSSVKWTHTQAINGSYATIYPKIATDTIAQHFYVCGTYSNTTLQAMLYQLTPSGNRSWIEYYDGAVSGKDIYSDLVVDGIGRIYLPVAVETSTTNVYDYVLVRYSQTPAYMPVNYNMVADTFNMAHLYYPNSGEIIDSSRTSVTDVLYYTKFTNPAEFVLQNKVAFCWYKVDSSRANPSDTISRIDMIFSGANEFSKLYSFDSQNEAVLNYFMEYLDTIGITNVKGASHLMVPNIYNLIDLHYTSNSLGAKYYFVVKPGGNPSDISLYFDGASTTTITGSDLQISSDLGSVTFKNPDVYNVSVASFTNLAITTTSVTGTSGWVSMGSDTYSINPGAYSSSWPLVIEFDMGKATTPSSVAAIGNLDWSTYLGGAGIDEVKDVKMDASSNLYAVGKTYSSTFPNAVGNVYQNSNGGFHDAFISKFTNTVSGVGVPDWSTYVGGNRTDFFNSLDIHPTSGNIYCVGATNSDNLITIPKSGATNSAWVGPYASPFGYMQDGLIFEIVPTGTASAWCTYYGGNSDDEFTKVKFDGSGNMFVVGWTCSSNASVVTTGSQYSRSYNNGAYTFTDHISDGYIGKFDGNSSITWATTIGASSPTSSYTPNDELYDLTFDANDDLYVTGFSSGTNYTVTGGGSGITGQLADAVYSRFDNTGVLKYSTYLGGNGWEKGWGITTNTTVSSDVYISGYAGSGFPTTNSSDYYYTSTHAGGTDDAFFAVYNSSNTKVHATYIGGNGDDEAKDIEVDDYGFIHISGRTKSTNFYAPSSNTLGYNYTPSGVGGYDIFIVTLKKYYPDVAWTCIIGSDKDESGWSDSQCEITVDNTYEMLYLGSKTDMQTTTKYPILGIAPTYTQAVNGANDGCISRFRLGNIHRSAIGIQELSNLSNETILVYPNPTNSVLNIKILNFNKRLYYHVYNAIGQVILTGNIEGSENIINVTNISSGIYFLEISDGENKANTKFIKNE